nr:hypothetical transcript [Hymenolepis microstoma]
MAPSSRIHVTVVGTGSPGSPKSVLLCTDKTRYLINCGEGTQRILTEHNEVVRSPKIRQLIEGESLALDNGKVISPNDVTSEPITPRNILGKLIK